MPADDPPHDPARRALAAARAAAARRSGRRHRPDATRSGAGDGEPAWSGAGDDARDPQPLGTEIERLADEAGWRRTLPAARVLGAFDTVVGPDIAAHCRPDRLVDGELRLVAESTAWATQLRLLAGPILAKVEAVTGPGVVHRIVVVGPATPSWRHGPRRIVGPGPRDTYG